MINPTPALPFEKKGREFIFDLIPKENNTIYIMKIYKRIDFKSDFKLLKS